MRWRWGIWKNHYKVSLAVSASGGVINPAYSPVTRKNLAFTVTEAFTGKSTEAQVGVNLCPHPGSNLAGNL